MVRIRSCPAITSDGGWSSLESGPSTRRSLKRGSIHETAGSLPVGDVVEEGRPSRSARRRASRGSSACARRRKRSGRGGSGGTGIGRAQRGRVERVPAPVDFVLVEVAREARQRVDRRATSSRLPAAWPGHRVETVRPGRPGDRAEPAVDHAVLGRRDGRRRAGRRRRSSPSPARDRAPAAFSFGRPRGRDPREVARRTPARRSHSCSSTDRPEWSGSSASPANSRPVEVVDRVALPGVLVEVLARAREAVDVGRAPARRARPAATGSRACGRTSGSRASPRRCARSGPAAPLRDRSGAGIRSDGVGGTSAAATR